MIEDTRESKRVGIGIGDDPEMPEMWHTSMEDVQDGE